MDFNTNAETHTSPMSDTTVTTPSTKQSSVATRLLNGSQRRKQIVLSVVAIVLIVVAAGIILPHIHHQASVKGANTTDPSKVAVNKNFSFAARGADQKIVDNKPLTVTLNDVYLSNTILINGQQATAKGGKTFLILDMSITNPYQDTYYLPLNNFVRLQMGNLSFAPDVHNGIVLIDPIATKTSRLGFLVDAASHNFTLKIGEVNGQKQTIDLKL